MSENLATISMELLEQMFTLLPHLQGSMPSNLFMGSRWFAIWLKLKLRMMIHLLRFLRCMATCPTQIMLQRKSQWCFSSMVYMNCT